MRCRKVRSFLSAYCRDELVADRKLRVSEHLLTCSGCHREEALQRQLVEASLQLPPMPVSEDFNARLLNRIANERFAQTRNRAYMPKSAPSLVWRRLVPVVATACAVLLLAVTYWPLSDQMIPTAPSASGIMGDAYLTAQPDSNPNLTVNLHKDWSLNEQLAWARQVDRISSSITPVNSFGGFDASGRVASVQALAGQTPYWPTYHRMRPIMKVYVAPQTGVGQEDAGSY